MENNKNTKPKTKRQHYIPVFLLNNFCDETGRMKVFDKNSGKDFYTKPKDICFENYLYEPKLTDDYFSAPNELENNFRDMECYWAQLIYHIINICDNPNNRNRLLLQRSEKYEVAKFFYNIFARNPYNLNMMSKSVEEMGLHDLFHLFANYGIGEDKHICKNFDLHMAFNDGRLGENFCNDLLKSYFYIGYSENGKLCTSNCPFLICGNDLLYALLPISPKYAIIWLPTKIKDKSNILISLTQKFTTKLREHYLQFNAVRWIFSKP